MALQADGWFLRQTIIWHKPGPMPESVRDRCTKAHEYIFLLTKSARYYYDAEAVKEECAESTIRIHSSPSVKPRAGRWKIEDNFDRNDGRASDSGLVNGTSRDLSGRNRRSVWSVATQPYSGAHFATFPPALIAPCILAGTSERGCCPKCGAPWERVVERVVGSDTSWSMAENLPAKKASAIEQGFHGKKPMLNRGSKEDYYANQPHNRTTGWRPGCECGGDPVPCTVLDPFGGSGTTGEVASGNGRRAVLVELNPEYAKLAQDRCGLFCSPNKN